MTTPSRRPETLGFKTRNPWVIIGYCNMYDRAVPRPPLASFTNQCRWRGFPPRTSFFCDADETNLCENWTLQFWCRVKIARVFQWWSFCLHQPGNKDGSKRSRIHVLLVDDARIFYPSTLIVSTCLMADIADKRFALEHAIHMDSWVVAVSHLGTTPIASGGN